MDYVKEQNGEKNAVNPQLNVRVPPSLRSEFVSAVATLQNEDTSAVERRLTIPLRAAILMFARASKAEQSRWLREATLAEHAARFPGSVEETSKSQGRTARAVVGVAKSRRGVRKRGPKGTDRPKKAKAG